MKTTITIMVLGLMVTTVGMLRIQTVQQHRALWNQYEKALTYKNELNTEWNKLQIEESMLITSVLLDSNIRERLGMVLPKQDSVVYVVEQKASPLVSTNSDQNLYLQ